MKKKYGDIYNKKTILNFSYFKFKKTFQNEEDNLIKNYNLYVINSYIEDNYEYTIRFLKNVKRILKKTKVKLLDLDMQELLFLEERVFSVERQIKTLSTYFLLEKGEVIGIKFVNVKIYKKEKMQLKLIGEGTFLFSNQRIIFTNDHKTLLFYWKEIKKVSHSEDGFEFTKGTIRYILRIHDSETLNNTIKNYLSKINKNV